MSYAADLQDFKAALSTLLTAFDKRQGLGAVDSYAGCGDSEPLEHTTRVLLIDGIIRALGWRLADGAEVVEEARVHAATTLFIDYLGVDPEQRNPLLIVEAKAWDKPFVRGRDSRFKADSSQLIWRAIQHIRGGGSSSAAPVILEWHDWLVQIQSYVKGLLDKHGHMVERVVITTGQWMVIFTNPVSTFCTAETLLEEHWTILQKEEFVRQSDLIYQLVARNQLIKKLPRHIRLAQLSAYMCASDIQAVFHSLAVKYETSGHTWFSIEPQIHLYPSILLVRSDGQLVSILGSKERFSIPHDEKPATLIEHCEAVASASQALLEELSIETGVPLAPSPLADFPGFPRRPKSRLLPLGSGCSEQLGAQEVLYVDMDGDKPGEGIVATGTNTHILLAQPTLECRFHEWATCRANGGAVTPYAITVRSINPRSFFKDGEQHHCSHQGMHDRRDSRCKIDVLDKYLCCKVCIFQRICWTDQPILPLPCGQ